MYYYLIISSNVLLLTILLPCETSLYIIEDFKLEVTINHLITVYVLPSSILYLSLLSI